MTPSNIQNLFEPYSIDMWRDFIKQNPSNIVYAPESVTDSEEFKGEINAYVNSLKNKILAQPDMDGFQNIPEHVMRMPSAVDGIMEALITKLNTPSKSMGIKEKFELLPPQIKSSPSFQNIYFEVLSKQIQQRPGNYVLPNGDLNTLTSIPSGLTATPELLNMAKKNNDGI